MTRVHGGISSSFRDENGVLVEYFRGDEVKPEHVELLDSWGALVPIGEEHLTPEERLDRALNPDLVDAQEAPESPRPASGTSDPITGDYDAHTAPELQAEIERRHGEGRDVVATGTGQGGNVLKADLVKALQDADEASSS